MKTKKKKSALYSRGLKKGYNQAIKDIKQKLSGRCKVRLEPDEHIEFSSGTHIYNRSSKVLYIYGKPGQVVTFFYGEK